MDQLAPSHVPTYETVAEGRELWQRCADRGLPVVAVRDGERGYVVRYDLQHMSGALSDPALRELQNRVRSVRSTTLEEESLTDPDLIDGETGRVAGELHAETEGNALRLASHVSTFVFDESNRV